MLEAVTNVLSGILEGIFDGWYSEQSWWVKTLVWTLIIFVVLAFVYFLFPQILSFTSSQ